MVTIVKKNSVYNNTLIPTIFKSLKSDYLHLIKHVQLWDVSCQKVIEISGKNSLNLIKVLFCRDFNKIIPGRAYYSPIVNFEGKLLNDPVVFCLSEDRFYISLSDSDLFNWISAINHTMKFHADVNEAEIFTLAVQGPKSEDLMASIFGEDIRKLKFFNFRIFDFLGTKQVIARSGYSKQDGFEIYFKCFEDYFDKNEMGEKIWDIIWKAGKEFNIAPGCPNLIDRIEAGLMSYGNDFTKENNPIECNLEKYCNNESDHDFIGKNAFEKIKKQGVKQKLKGVLFDGINCPPCSIPFPLYSKDKKLIGKITSGIYSPKFKKNIGLSMILNEFCKIGSEVLVHTPDNKLRKGIVSSLPFSK